MTNLRYLLSHINKSVAAQAAPRYGKKRRRKIDDETGVHETELSRAGAGQTGSAESIFVQNSNNEQFNVGSRYMSARIPSRTSSSAEIEN